MNEVERQVLYFMRDVAPPEQASLTADFINKNIAKDVNERRLRLMEKRGMVEGFDKTLSEPTKYGMTAAGLQAITTEDLNQSLSNTNEKLDSTVTELENMQRSNTRSAAVQTIFSVSIIIFSVAQILNIVVENGGTLLEIGVLVAIGLILTSAVAAIGKDSIVKTVMMSL